MSKSKDKAALCQRFQTLRTELLTELLVSSEGGKALKDIVRGKDKVKSGPAHPACCYCLFGQKTSVIARDEGRRSCEARGQRAGRPAELAGSSPPRSANTQRGRAAALGRFLSALPSARPRLLHACSCRSGSGVKSEPVLLRRGCASSAPRSSAAVLQIENSPSFPAKGNIWISSGSRWCRV